MSDRIGSRLDASLERGAKLAAYAELGNKKGRPKGRPQLYVRFNFYFTECFTANIIATNPMTATTQIVAIMGASILFSFFKASQCETYNKCHQSKHKAAP